MPRTAKSKAIPPVYLLRTGALCPWCGQATNASTLLASALYYAPEEDTFPGPLVLKNIESLLLPLLALFYERCPTWRFDRGSADEPSYLMNHCYRCRGQLTDHYLHDEPGFAFFPTSPEQCRTICLFALADEFSHSVPLVCSWTCGGLTDFLDYRHPRPLAEL